MLQQNIKQKSAPIGYALYCKLNNISVIQLSISLHPLQTYTRFLQL